MMAVDKHELLIRAALLVIVAILIWVEEIL